MMKLLICILLTMSLTCCSGQETNKEVVSSKTIDKQCKDLNDSAVSYIEIYYQSLNKDELFKASRLLRQAVECDSSYFLALSNLSSVYALKGDYVDAIDVIDKLLELSANDNEILVHKASLLQKLDKNEDAENIYDQVNKSYVEIIDRNPNDLETISNYIFFLAVSEGQGSALNYLDSQLQKKTNNMALKNLRVAIENFDREEYLNSIGAIN